MKRSELKAKKRTEAIARQRAYNALSVQQKLARLDAYLSIGIDAKKERAKLRRKQDAL